MVPSTLREWVWGIGVPIILWLLFSIVKKTRAITQLHRQLKEEEAQQARNPYADMARLYEEQETLKAGRRALGGQRSTKEDK